MHSPVILGFDPGLTNFGYAVIQGTRLIDIGVHRTDKSDAKRKVLASDDNTRRIRELAAFAWAKWHGERRVICAESMSFPRNSSSAAKMAMTWGVIVTLAHVTDSPLLQASPQEVKKFVCQKKDASKKEIEGAVVALYPKATTLLEEQRIAQTYREHAYDALAVAITCRNSDTVRMMSVVSVS
jgi:Holliday junction resolvasome RuvABC endonuclease subunit